MNAQEPVMHLMSAAVLSIDVRQPAGDVIRQFAGYPVHHMPVVDGGKVVGMLSSADLIKLDAFLPRSGVRAEAYLDQHITIRNLMRRPAITIGTHASIEDAAKLMASQGVHALPVVNSQDCLVGIITTTDIMHAALQAETSATMPAADDAASVHSGAGRLGALEGLYRIAARFVSGGQDGPLHAALVQAVDAVRRLSDDGTPTNPL